jgi:hypothetical protein
MKWGPRCIEADPQEAGMKSEFPDIELIQNRGIVTAVFAEMSSLGQLLICHGCDDVEAVIVGFLVLEQSEQAFALCGSCVRKLPLMNFDDQDR